jgi:hypothetical protein
VGRGGKSTKGEARQRQLCKRTKKEVNCGGNLSRFEAVHSAMGTVGGILVSLKGRIVASLMVIGLDEQGEEFFRAEERAGWSD